MADISKIKTPDGTSYDIKDPISRNGGGVQLTKAQYDALVNAGTVDANTTYFITDANNTTASYAAGVTYDNTSSGLSATNVQGAIDEVNAKGIYLATFEFTKSINATTQTTYSITRSDFGLPTGAKVKSCFLRESTYNAVNAGGLVYSAKVNETATNAIEGAMYNGTTTNRVYRIMATVFYTLA